METVVRPVRLVQVAMLASIALYATAGEALGHSRVLNSALFYMLSLAAISTLGVAFVVRRTLVLPSEALLRRNPNDSALQARWKSGYIFLYALCEAMALFGLVLQMTGFSLSQVWGFYFGGFLLLLLFSPRVPA